MGKLLQSYRVSRVCHISRRTNIGSEMLILIEEKVPDDILKCVLLLVLSILTLDVFGMSSIIFPLLKVRSDPHTVLCALKCPTMINGTES